MDALVARHLEPLAREALATFPALVVQGGRQVGKSTFARMLAAGRPHRVLDLDDPETRDAVREDPRLATTRAPGETVVIDEVQRAPELVLALKAAIDADRRPGSFVLTGSSNLLVVASMPDSLAGRAVTLTLSGFSQGELAGTRDDFAGWVSGIGGRGGEERVAALEAWSRDRYPAALAAGGFPEVQALAPAMRELWLESYVERLIRRDAGDLRGRLSPGRLRAVLMALAANQAGELVKARVARATDVPETSLPTYLDALAALYLTVAVPPWGANLTKRAVGIPKCLVADSAIALSLDRMGEDQLLGVQGNRAFGGLLEGLAMSELAKQGTWSSERPRLFHLRDSGGLEVDAVLELRDGRVVLIEVKAASTYRAQHFAALKKLSEALGDRLVAGVVLATADHAYRYGDKLWGLPISALWTPAAPTA
jgi:predicted AAA+ superfamily ATPase